MQEGKRTGTQAALAALRVLYGLLFMEHGVQKLFGWLASQPRAPVELFTLMGLAGVLETFGGLLLVLGLLVRPVAIVLALEMAYAYLFVHLPRGLAPILNGGESALLYGTVFVYLAIRGGGRFSLDRWLDGWRAPR